jgi:hypothetical protein
MGHDLSPGHVLIVNDKRAFGLLDDGVDTWVSQPVVHRQAETGQSVTNNEPGASGALPQATVPARPAPPPMLPFKKTPPVRTAPAMT